MNAKTFKEQFDLVKYAKDNFGGDERGDKLFIHCPFHSESTPSCVISNHGWHCFGACGTGGDSIDFIMRVTNMEFKTIINNADMINEFRADAVQKKAATKKSANISPAVFKNYQSQLLRNKNKIKYLTDRGFDLASIEAAKLGYGIPIDVFGWKFRHPRFVIPHFQSGKIIGVKYRIDPRYKKYESEKYISHPGTAGSIYNVDMFASEQKIIYVGSQFDAAVLWYRYNIPAVCPPSENTFRDEWIPLFIDKSILIWLDNDETGINSSMSVYRKIRNVVKCADIFIWNNTYQKKDDFTDFLLKEGIDKVRNIYDNYC